MPGAEHEGTTTHPAKLHCRIALDDRHHRIHVRHLLQRLGIVPGQWTHAGNHGPGQAEGVGLAWADGDQIGAELGELGQHEAVDPLANGGQQHDRRHANGDPNHGQ